MARSEVTTARQIAKEAGLSHSTVSLVLNQRGDELGIRRETQKRVFAIAKKLNYVPNPLAKGLRGGRTHTLGVLWSMAGPHDSELMTRRIALRAYKQGYITQLADHLGGQQLVQRALSDLARRSVDAVVMQDGPGDFLHRPEIIELLKSFPAALVVSTQAWDAPCDLIVHDRLSAYREVVDHFADSGRQRPGILLPLSTSRDKADAFVEHAHLRGLTSADVIDVPLSDDRKLTACYRDALDRAFPNNFPFDCLLCSTDEGAVVAMSWFRQRGLKIPADVAVVGFNDSMMSEFLDMPLASIDRRDEQVADAIEHLIFTRLSVSDKPLERVHVPMRFIWRESAGQSSKTLNRR